MENLIKTLIIVNILIGIVGFVFTIYLLMVTIAPHALFGFFPFIWGLIPILLVV